MLLQHYPWSKGRFPPGSSFQRYLLSKSKSNSEYCTSRSLTAHTSQISPSLHHPLSPSLQGSVESTDHSWPVPRSRLKYFVEHLAKIWINKNVRIVNFVMVYLRVADKLCTCKQEHWETLSGSEKNRTKYSTSASDIRTQGGNRTILVSWELEQVNVTNVSAFVL